MIKGSKMSAESRKKVSEGHKGQIAWNKGKKMTDEEKLKINMSGLEKGRGFFKGKKRPELSGENHPNWKEAITYSGVHQWVRNYYGKASCCQNINCFYPKKNKAGITIIKPKVYHWANISGLYKRNIQDWMQLCPSCHSKYDSGILKVIHLRTIY